MPVFSIPLSGLNAASAALSTIANNLANLNTVGYKQERTVFRDLFYQNLGATGSGDPIQVGAGASVAAVNSNFNPGSVDTTGVSTDVAITGEGFFVVQKEGTLSYTRAGNFTTAKDGTLITNDGEQVLGYPAANGVVAQAQGLAPLVVGSGHFSPPSATSSLKITANLDAGASAGEVCTTPVTVYDSLGQTHVLTAKFTKTAANAWDYEISIPAVEVGKTGNAQVVTSGQLSFDGSGTLTSPAADVSSLTIAGLADGAADLGFSWQLYNGSTPVISQVASPSSASDTWQNGFGAGSLLKFDIGSDGIVQGTFSNGRTSVLGQIVLANFPDVQGLAREGGNNFNDTLASGAAAIGAPGTGGRGSLKGGALELSNVDMAKEFAQMIMAQRGFQANARAITTFDEITQETINLKR